MNTRKTDIPLLISSKKRNRYLYDRNLRKMILCHPVLYHILNICAQGQDPIKWFEGIKNEEIDIDGYGTISRSEAQYYLRKYLVLKENGYFRDPLESNRFELQLNAEDVRESLANTRQLTFEITEQCCLKCKYCAYGEFYADYNPREDKNIDSDAAIRLVDYLVELWNSPLNHSHEQNIYIGFYGGEPLMNFPFIQEMVSYIEKLKPFHNRFTFSMTTNGVLLDKHTDFLAGHNFNLLISLDGDKNANRYRVFQNGKPSYRAVMKNILELKHKHPGYFEKKVNFNAVLHRGNSVQHIYDFFKENFGKHPGIQPLNTSGIAPEQEKTFWETYSNLEESLFKSEHYPEIEQDMFIKLPTIQNLSNFIHSKNDFSYDNYNDLFCSPGDQIRFPTGTCKPFSRKVFVTAAGKIIACERIGHDYTLGEVNKEGVFIDFQKIAGYYNSLYDKMRRQCSVCFNADNCNQCIFNLNLKAENPVCYGYMNMEIFMKHFSSCVDFLESKPRLYSKILNDIVVD